jgi:hypothetical protein
MALTYPRDMPAKGRAGQQFDIYRIDYSAPEAGGALGGIQSGVPRFYSIWTLGKMGADASDALQAFADSMRGGQRRFYGRDLSRPYPKLYQGGFARMRRTGGAPFDGSATSWSETTDAEDNSLLTLGGLAAGLILSIRDYVGFKWDCGGDPEGSYKGRALVRLVEPAIVDGAGSVTVNVEPAVPAIVPEGAIAHLDNPCCIMGLMTDQNSTLGYTQLGPIDRSLAMQSGTIVALQDLRL